MIPFAIPRSALLALVAAISWGGGDFAGGMGVKRAGGTLSAALRIVLLSHATSLTLLTTAALLRGDPFPHGAAVAWSLATGLAGGVSVTAFYIALAEGAMGSAAAMSGLLAAAIPAVAGFFLEGAPHPLALLGFALAAGAIWLIAAGSSSAGTSRRAILLAIASGTGFGIYFVGLRMSSRAGLLWPLCGSRVGSLSVCLVGIAVMALRRPRRTPPHSDQGPAPAPAEALPAGTPTAVSLTRSAVFWALGTALMDTGGNLFFMAATRAGRLDIAAVLASLYPASTILLAAWLLRERPTLRQGIGMLVAGAAVVLITL